VSILERVKSHQAPVISVRKLKRERFSELMRRDMAAADAQKRGSLSAYQKSYLGLLYGTLASFLVGTVGTASLSVTTGVDLTALALVPSAVCGVLLTQSEKLVYLNRLRRGKARSPEGTTDLGEFRADPISKETH